MSEVQTASRRIVKKITTKVVLGGKPSIEKLIEHNKAHGKDAVMPLFGIIGKCSDSMAGDGDNGPFVKLFGQFKAVNHDTGEVFRSGGAILPGSANDMVYGALRGLGEGGGAVEFAFNIGVVRDESSATGYVYVVEQIVMEGQDDGLADLEKRLSGPGKVAQITDAREEQQERQPAATGNKKR